MKPSTGALVGAKIAWAPRRVAFCIFFCATFFAAGCVQVSTPTTTMGDPGIPPPTPREFRAAWVATVANIDWPSKKDLTVEQQKQEIVRIVERAKALKLNALVFQVRPAADALYPSILEPWSEYLTGEQGKMPNPYYDPLKMWVEEAHKRGIELHAWFNPYRARHTSAKSPNAAMHIANTNPEVVKSYGGYQWMDPGEALAAQRTLDVILDVVRRYDIDGIHVDDYFYPYPVNVPGSMPPVEENFPDDPAWLRHVGLGGGLSRADWRRRNVDQLMEQIYHGVHRAKPWVRVGISPFGLGRPDRRPPGIVGFSQYDKLYADVELWLSKGWLDYLVPQLYWPIEQRPQAFEVLLDYWLTQNTMNRHVWPGLYTSRINNTEKSWPVDEIIKQIALTRSKTMAQGHVHFSMVALTENRKGINDQLTASTYKSAALIPAAPWLAAAESTPVPPLLSVDRDQAARTITVNLTSFKPLADGHAWQLAAWVRRGGVWQFEVAPAFMGEVSRADVIIIRFPYSLDDAAQIPDKVVAFSIDRFGTESARVTWTAGATK
ncbi:MAG: family 10 glycosylhydrolase [Burkholderiales bacterium]|nr:family 10 glycosylhydrolase [Burkholderiales bacterium]